MLHHPGAALTVLALATLAVVLAISVRSVGHRKLTRAVIDRSVPARVAGVSVRTGDLGDAAFVAGLRRPTIFCDRDLPGRLSYRELRAVILHECSHRQAADPARLLVIEAIAPVARLLPFGRQWVAWSLARREIAADRFAMERGATPQELASALLRLPAPAQAHVMGFTGAVDLRLRALLGENVEAMVPIAVRRARVMLPAAVLGVGLGAWTLHQYVGGLLGHVCC